MSSLRPQPFLSGIIGRVLALFLVCVGGDLPISQAAFTSAITPDGTLGTTVTQTGKVYDINGGTIKGTNQFHSLRQFTVGTGDTASFNGPAGILNILSRVTGGSQSIIDGQLRSTIAGANLYLMNPSGVLFGPNATLNLSGSFHVTTADYLRLMDNVRFNAVPDATKDSLLTTAPVATFGFLTPTPAPISFLPGTTLQMPPGQVLSIIGGNIQAVGTQLSSPAGLILIASVGSPGEVVLGPPGLVPNPLDVSSFSSLGRIDLQSSVIDVSGSAAVPVGGAILIRSGQLVMENSLVQSITVALDGGPISIAAPSIELKGGQIQTASLGPAKVGDIQITTGTLSMTDGALIASLLVPNPLIPGQPRGGTILVTANDSISMSGQRSGTFSFLPSIPGLPQITNTPSGIYSENFSANKGSGIIVQTPSLTLEPGVLTSHAFSTGAAGDHMYSLGQLALKDGGVISSDAFGDGPTGKVQVAAIESIDISGFLAGTSGVGPLVLTDLTSGISTDTFAGGAASKVSVSTSSLNMNNGHISSNTFGPGPAEGVDLQAGKITLAAGAGITSTTFRQGGAGGNVTVTATEQISISGHSGRSFAVGDLVFPDNESGIATATFGAGKSGNITVTSPALFMHGDGIIQAATGSDGGAGTITVNVGSASLASGALISSSSGLILGDLFLIGNGAGGNIRVTAIDSLTIAGHSALDPARPSGLLTTAVGGGPGGSITVQAGQLQMQEGAVISAETRGPGPAGDIALDVTSASLNGGSLVSANTFGAGQGGKVTVTAAESLMLLGETPGPVTIGGVFVSHLPSGITTVAFADGQGGQIRVSTPTLAMQKGVILAETFGTGNAGEILVNGGKLVLTDGAQIAASSSGSSGKGGRITVRATDSITIDGNRTDVFLGAGLPVINGPSGFFTNADGTGDGGVMSVSSPILTIGNGQGSGQIAAQTFGPANAGSILVEVGSLTLANGALISGTTLGAGQGGNVTVTATDSISISGRNPGSFGVGSLMFNHNQSGIVSIALAEGKAGRISVSAADLSVHDQGLISAATGGAGAGGDVVLNSSTLSLMTSGQISSSSGLRIGDAFFVGNGAGGDINVHAGRIQLDDGAIISASSFGLGNAGNISITAADQFVMRNSTVTTQARQADGGNIDLRVGNRVQLVNSDITTSVGTGVGNGGNITIDPQVFVLDHSHIIANAFGGKGGNINISAGVFLTSPDSIIDASSALGVNGVVAIQSPVQNLSGTLSPLPSTLLTIAPLTSQCAARAQGGTFSSFTVAGRDRGAGRARWLAAEPSTASWPQLNQR